MQTAQVKIGNYSNNYGSSRYVQIGDLTLYFSYETVIAFNAPKFGTVVRQNSWGTTTGKHLNAIDGGNKKARLPSEEFESKLNSMLSKYKLSV